MRPGCDHLRQPRGAAEDVAEQLAQGAVGTQDRQELDTRGHARQRFVEGGKRGVGVARSGESFEQRRRQFRQHLSRAGAADRGAPAKVPAANRFRCDFRTLKPKRAQGGERLRIIGDAGEDKVARSDAEFWRVFEQPRVMPLDPGHVMDEVGGESVEPRVAAEFGEARKRRAFERKALRLLVSDHLQPMFDTAQERVGLGEVVNRFRADPFVGAELLKHFERA